MSTPRVDPPRRSSRVAFIVAAAIGFAALLVLFLLADAKELLRTAQSVHPAALALPMLLSVLSYGAMARSYQGIADAAGARLSFRDWLRITFVSNTANYIVTSAGLSGFAVRMLLLAQQGVTSSRAVLISLVQTFLTNFTLLFFILGGFVSLVVRKHLGGAFLWITTFAVVAFAVVLVFVFVLAVRPALRRRTLRWVTVTLHRVLHRVARRWTPPRERFVQLQRNLDQGFDFLLTRKTRMVAPTLWILFDWVLTVGVLWAAFQAVNFPLPPRIVIMGFGVGLFFSLVSFVPAGLGIMEGSMTYVFVKFLKVPLESSVLAVLIFRLTYQVVPLFVSLFLFHGLVRQALRQVASGSRG
ncbi:MAG TPA: lysylphosphatidylglycerol synthase transmembrane domain-containing protein [Candidatus Eisenbacteria bacterium]|nr:lysylphosphatidylglycerol synthase transmembrane domain-containing protein [Candidatus Eisenbacteria bacterium]